ncbi:hypothetical protein C8R43DRAFT_951878 [Mycena crocata]|nr:hypothetical protein C8R43DRAFT_951878 [Mycena crocata]
MFSTSNNTSITARSISPSSLWATLSARITPRARSASKSSVTPANRHPISRHGRAGKPLLKRTSLHCNPVFTPFVTAPSDALGLPDLSSLAKLESNTKFNTTFTIDSEGLIEYIQRPSRKFPDVGPPPAELDELSLTLVWTPAECFSPSFVSPDDERKVRFRAAVEVPPPAPIQNMDADDEPVWSDFMFVCDSVLYLGTCNISGK